MGISPQDFRIRTGMFCNTRIKQKNKTKPEKSRMKNFAISITFYLTFLFLMNFLLPSSTSGFKNNNIIIKSGMKKCISNNVQQFNQHFLTCWSQYGLSNNKIQKIINGNRRIIGYKLALWNCSRGLIQDGFSSKLEEIKQFVDLKKPHCFAIIESDIYNQNF